MLPGTQGMALLEDDSLFIQATLLRSYGQNHVGTITVGVRVKVNA
jgi:hypothetical protein